MSRRFPIWYSYECCSEWTKVYFHLRSFFESLYLYSNVDYIFGKSVLFTSFLYFTPKLFCFLVIWLLVCLRSFTTYFLEYLFFIVLECPVLLHCFILSPYVFSLPSVSKTFWLISSCCIVYFSCVALFFSSQHVPVLFLSLIFLLAFVDFLSAF